jgi:hypothetical protein
MATYKDLIGTAVRNNAGNLSEGQKDQIFYDSTNIDFKYQFETLSSAWRTGNDMVNSGVPGNFGGGSNGPQTSGIAVTSSNPSPTGRTELYDGTSWTSAPNTNTNRRGAGVCASVNTAAIAFGGEQSPSAWYTINESWNGSSWTEVNDLNAGRVSVMSIGSSTAGLAIGGVSGTPANYQKNESWDGTSFTEVGDMNTGRAGTGAAGGTSTSGIAWTNQSGYEKDNETWNGSAWTASADLNTAKAQDGGSGASNTSALSFGGTTSGGRIANTELWNGTAWTETNDLNTAIAYQYHGGTADASWSAGGMTAPGAVTTSQTEEWNANQPVGAWSTQTSLNTGRSDVEGAGASAEAALAFGGQATTGVVAVTESFNGSTWTEVNDMNTARNGFGGNGIQTSALGYGQDDPARSAITESWNGSSWTEVGDLNTAKRAVTGLGADNESALCFGGETASTDNLDETELWNGTSWTEVNNLNTARLSMGGTGIVTAGLAVAGRKVDPDSNRSEVEQWDGTSWTEVGDVNTARYGGTASQSNYSNSFFAGGSTGSSVANTELWNGVSWVEVADLSTARQTGAPAGTQSGGGLCSGGTPSSVVVEEWSSTSNTIKVLTD